MNERAFTVRVPASTSNLGSGFDTISAALGLYLTVEVQLVKSGKLEWIQGEDACSTFPETDNLICRSLEKAIDFYECELPGMQIRMHNPIPLQRGLGSSAAAIVAGIKIAETVAGQPLDSETIFELAYPLEGHPDNLAASLLGGWVLSWITDNRMKARRLDSKLDCQFVVCVPEVTVSTREARAILPQSCSLADAIYNLQRCALLVHALHAGEKSLLKQATSDRLHQPYRAELVPGMKEILKLEGIKLQLAPSVLGVCVSGSGSAVVVLTEDHSDQIGEWMVETFASHKTSAAYRIVPLDTRGARVSFASRDCL